MALHFNALQTMEMLFNQNSLYKEIVKVSCPAFRSRLPPQKMQVTP